MNSWHLLPHVRDLYSKHPEMYYLAPWEVQSALFVLGYTNDLAEEGEIAAAVEAARGDHPQWRAAMTPRPWISAYTLSLVARYTPQKLWRSMPRKEKPAKELPYAWRLALVGAVLRLLVEDSNRPEPPFILVLTGTTKTSDNDLKK